MGIIQPSLTHTPVKAIQVRNKRNTMNFSLSAIPVQKRACPIVHVKAHVRLTSQLQEYSALQQKKNRGSEDSCKVWPLQERHMRKL